MGCCCTGWRCGMNDAAVARPTHLWTLRNDWWWHLSAHLWTAVHRLTGQRRNGQLTRKPWRGGSNPCRKPCSFI